MFLLAGATIPVSVGAHKLRNPSVFLTGKIVVISLICLSNMKLTKIFCVLLTGWVLISNSGCHPEFEVYAPEKSIRVIYSVLNASHTVQYVKVSRVYQIRSDAERYAAENDLSIHDLNVRLTDLSNNFVYQAEQVDSVEKDSTGIFYRFQTLYRFHTDGNSTSTPKLATGRGYKLEVGFPESGAYNFATTTIPSAPGFRSGLAILAGAGNTRCLPKLNLIQPLQISWEKSSGLAYELSVLLRYTRNGVPDSAMWGPTNLIENNVRCSDGSNRICYEFAEEQLLTFFKQRLPEDGTQYYYERHDSCISNPTNDPAINDLLPKSVEFKVVAVDEFLYKYMLANDPSVTDLTGAKPEYTNMEGDIEAIGVFGSISQDRRWAIFNTCTEYHLGLNGITTLPTGCPQ